MTAPQSPFATPQPRGPSPAAPPGALATGGTPATGGVPAPAPAPSISLPKSGGAVRGIGEKFSANAVTGTASMTVPISLSKGRAGFGPALALSYDSGRGNGPFGFGWGVGLPAVTRRTDKGLPRYGGDDVFLLSDADDLVPVASPVPAQEYPAGYSVQCFRPRVEGLFARIERWTRTDGDVHWQSITRENVTTVYGGDASSRIFDPADPARVFGWLISSSYDTAGNVVIYEYVAEDGRGVDVTAAPERQRSAADRGAQRYLKRIRYGNRVSRLVGPTLDDPQWMFEAVLDYGDHDPDAPLPAPDRDWTVRDDPFSTYRPGFEVRTYRLCHRVLMFHHFPAEAGVGADCLVRATELGYAPDAAAGTFLTAVTSRGYARSGDGYVTRAMPPVELTYSAAQLHHTVVEVDAASLDNLPSGLATPGCRWVDLDGEGVAGMLLESRGGWYFKPNLGGARFGPAQELPTLPSLVGARVSLVDLAGDGQLDLVALAGPTPGFVERTADGGWEPFRPFVSLPVLDWADPNLRFADLDGDGHADLLVTEGEALTWHESWAEDGYGPAQRIAAPRSEDDGPRLLFATGPGGPGAAAVHLADMSGDGLADLVRIRNGEVCYWPNLGHGRFGRKVVMDSAPRFAPDELFDPQRVLLADVDGSGVTDLVYAGPRDVRLYRNRSGNGLTDAIVLAATPAAGTNAGELTVVDLLGTGTACLVWSATRPGEERRSLRYLDLFGGVKPHLLTEVTNNLGARTRVSYASSTEFYLADKAAGRPWQTRLPFPVQVLTQVETRDLVAGNRFVTRYAYHHGFFDGVEREFRGFGMVEQWDTGQLPAVGGPLSDDVAASHVPPVLTRTWFHTGAFAGTADGLSARYATEYWPEDAHLRLPDTVWPDGDVTTADLREACRALKGAILRQEVYAEDGSPVQDLPYSVTERSYAVELLAPKGANAHAVCFVRPRETLNLHYERRRYDVEVNGQATKRTDPRVTHEIVLDVDAWGNVLRSATVAYGRRYPDADLDPLLDAATRDAIRDAQARTAATLTVSTFTNPVQTATDHRAPMPADVRTYELVQVEPLLGQPFRLDEVRALADAAGDGAHDLPFEDTDAAGAVTPAPYRRLVEHNRVRYRRDDLTGPLPPGALQPRALVYESYRLAFTPGLLDVYQRSTGNGPPQNLLPQPAVVLGVEAGHVWADGGWWVPSGQARYSPGEADTPAHELAYAIAHFFTPVRHVDAFGAVTVAAWDAYDLLLLDVRDPVGNRVSAGTRAAAATSDAEALTPALDYRVLAPWLVSDANRNRTAVRYDALGLVTASATRGKPEEQLGDALTGLAGDVPEAVLAAYFADPLADPQALLGGATGRLLIDLHAFYRTRADPQPTPVAVAVLTRETHRDAGSRIQHRISYSDGFGREVQVKTQAEPDVSGSRWVGSGWVVYHNKGLPVRQYEPFFSATHAFELAFAAGVSPVVCYDPVGRAVALLGADGTYTKTRFDPWRHEEWDPNDTVLLDPRTDPDVAGYVAGFFAAQPPGWQTWYQRRASGGLGPREQQAATEAAVHAATPGTGYADTLGRTTVTVAHDRHSTNGSTVEARYPVRVVFDVEGAKRQTVDARGITVLRTVFDVAGRAIATRSPDTGDHWFVPDVAGVPVRRWDSRGFDTRHGYDAARRPTHLWVTPPGEPDAILAALTVYGEADPDAATHNVRGRPRYTFDGSGLLLSQRHDFKGNLLASRRLLARTFDATPDWAALDGVAVTGVEAAAQPLLEPQPLVRASDYDALNRPVMQVLPDTTVLLPRYNEAGLLETLSARLSGSATETPYVTNVDYDAQGRRRRVEHANGTVTVHEYDPLMFRVRRTVTTRGGEALQDLSYVYDPVGNPVDLHDASQQTLFYAGQVTTPDTHYVLDALYRLVQATGREHASLGVQPDQNGPVRAPLPHPNDPQAVRPYTQRYAYDPAGNIVTMAHAAGAGSWTRTYTYPADTNRLASHSVPGGSGSVSFGHDAHGNMVAMPHLGPIGYDHHDQMVSVDLGGGGTAYYTYDGAGRRCRRVLVRAGGVVEDHVYLPAFEVQRKRVNGQMVFERQTVHLGDERPAALVETTTVDLAEPQQAGARRTRFQLRDHVGSASIELDETAALISREEYHPYGTTSMWLATGLVEASPKRYRYTGKERDDETGLYYHGARYYIPWLGRWASYDPEGERDGESRYMYVRGNPVRFSDPDGADCRDEQRSGVGFWSALLPGHTGYAVRPQLNPCLKDHPGWQQWQAEADRKATIAAGSGSRVGHGVGVAAAAIATAAAAAIYFGGVAVGSVALSGAEQASLWALSNPAKMLLAETLVQFGIGLVDPHPPGGSPMDLPGPADDAGRLTRAALARDLAKVHSAEEVVKISVRFLKPKQLMEAIRATWAMDKQGLAFWRGEILEGVLAATRYRFYEWVGRLKGGYFKTFDFYANRIGIQLKTLNAVPDTVKYKGFIDALAAAKKAGVMEDGRPLAQVALDIAVPQGFRGPVGREADYAAAIKEIKEYGASKGVQVNVYGLTEKEMNLVIQSPTQ
ncbi:MAG TPA: SpvB/TcaC N-terminal domain-containing protein [Micromonosporaceae bacterium]|nr:SpvB/TcaC N-terminal domain-containing protein [Micromonosporaceae bacterium]